MGASQSSATSGSSVGQGKSVDTLKLAMANLNNKTGGAAGGCGTGLFFGGDDKADPSKEIREYEASLSAKAKEDVLRRLAHALSRAGISINADGDLDQIIPSLIAQLPSPKNKKTFPADAGKQKLVCETVARVLNDEFTPGVTKKSEMFIDTSLPMDEICRAVSEWAHSFAQGVNTEFLAVHASVKNALRNVEILAEIMREVHTKIMARVDAAADPAVGRDTDALREIYSRAENERRRFEEMVKNILNVQLAPAAKELELALRDESQSNATIKKLGLKPGSSQFSDTIAAALSGLGTAASIAHRVHKALKAVGLSVRQYLDSAEFGDFQRLLDAKIESGTVKADDLAKFLEAIDTLRRAFGERGNSSFRHELESDKTGGRHQAHARGGADEEPKSDITKRVERRELEKNIIVRDFASRMSRNYQELLVAVKALGPELGGKIPLTDKTDALNDALTRLRDMRENSERIEYALVGMYIDANARERKERFVNALRQVSSTCSTLMELEMFKGASGLFARLKAAIDAIEKTIDYFSDVVTKKYGGADFAEVVDEEHATGGARGGDNDVLPEIARSGLSLRDAVTDFAYYYYVARIRGNFEQTSKELESYGEKYVELLGDAVAARLNTLLIERKAITDRLTDAAKVAAQATAGVVGDVDTWWAGVKKWVAEEYETKAKFYRALQAMDLYMKAFVTAIAKDPEAVRDMLKMLDGTQVIARWFDESTGDLLCRAFDSMRSTDFVGAVAESASGAAAMTAAGAHYYDRVGAAPGDTFGIPETGRAPGDPKLTDAKKCATESLEHFQALKNLVNAFARIGDKFGGRELRTQTFMSPVQIYKALMDYMKQSAFSINAGNSLAPGPLATAAVNVPQPNTIAAIAGAVAPYQVYFGSVSGGTQGNWEIEDRYFTMIIKSMAAKVLTVIGVFDMFERKAPLVDLTPTRLIVGGGFDDEVPEVIEGAAALYFRLTRLVEFYRTSLYWDGAPATLAFRIAMLPELEGVFAGLIRLIFQKAISPESGDYSETEMRALVREINSIHEHFQSTQKALSAFVMEINRRMGVIKQKDMADYWKMVKISRSGQYGNFNDTNYAILPGEDENEVDRRAPSDGYVLPGAAAAANLDPFAGRTALDATQAPGGHRAMLREFRAKIDGVFADPVTRAQFGKTSYSLLIKQAESEIHRASSREAKFAVAVKLIQGTSVVGTDSNKAFMFHETVVIGLDMINTIETLLRRFSSRITALSPVALESAIMDALHKSAGAINARAPLIAALANPDLDRYVVLDTASFDGRSGIPLGTTAADVYQFAGSLFALRAGAALPNDPSTYQELSPGGLNAGQLTYLRGLRTAARLLTNYGLMMRDYFENLYDAMSSSGLVEVRFSTTGASGVQINFTKLRALAESMLLDVKYFLELFRPFLSKETIDRYEARSNRGSIFWLEENLVDGFFRSDREADPKKTLEGVSRRTSEVFGELTRETHVPLGRLIVNLAAGMNAAAIATVCPAPSAGDETRFEDYGQTFSEIVFYNAVDFNSRQTDLGAGAPADFELSGQILTARPGAPGSAAVPGRLGFYQSSVSMTRYRSLLFAYNQLVARYLNTMTDTAGGQRIYVNLINAFANGVASRSVSNPAEAAYPDFSAAGVLGMRGDPKTESILFASTAWILQRFLKDVNPTTQVPDHLVATLTDVPLYMKESMRANLPGLVKFFDMLMQKGDFVKQFLQKTNVRVARPSQVAIADVLNGGAVNANNVVPARGRATAEKALEAFTPAVSSADMKARLANIIDAIAGNAYSLSTSASEVLKELGDNNPVFMQVGEGSIETYKMRYNKLPLMPLSLSLWFLSDLEVADSKVFPRHTLGSSSFKLLYGTRQLLARSSPVGFEQLPSVKASLEAHNGVSSKREQIDAQRYLKFVQNVVATLRYAVDARNYKSMISTSSALFSTTSLVSDAGAADGTGMTYAAGQPRRGNTVYVLTKPTATEQMVLSVVESSNQDEEASKIADVVGGSVVSSSGAAGRERERLLNLIDMNLVPFNVHALSRDIPLAFSYNFEYTCEEMLAALFGEASSNFTTGRIDDASTRTTRQMFLRLLVDPYMEVSPEMYGSDVVNAGSAGFVHRIFRGDNNLGMGRPKLLADQFFNKVLFGSIYQSRTDFDEAGPAVGIGAARGRSAGPSFDIARRLSQAKADLAALRARLNAQTGGNMAAKTLAAGANADALRGAVHDLIQDGANSVIGIRAQIAAMAGAGVPGPIANVINAVLAVYPRALTGANKAARIAAPGFDAAVDAFELALAPVPNAIDVALANAVVRREAQSDRGAAPWTASRGARASSISYLSTDADSDGTENMIHTVALDVGKKARLEAIGKARFDTRLIRKMFFIVNMTRALRLKLNREMSQSRNVIVSSHMSVTPAVTEYGTDPFGPNESMDSRLNGPGSFDNRQRRFNDSDDL
jgi:hypothetical protein